MEDRRYKSTTHRRSRRMIVKPDLTTLFDTWQPARYRSEWVSNDLPQSAEQSIDVDCDRWAWGAMHCRQAAGCGDLLQRKWRQMHRVYTSFITPTRYFGCTEWQFEIRISISTNNISFIYTVGRHKNTPKFFYHNSYNTWPILIEVDVQCLG